MEFIFVCFLHSICSIRHVFAGPSGSAQLTFADIPFRPMPCTVWHPIAPFPGRGGWVMRLCRRRWWREVARDPEGPSRLWHEDWSGIEPGTCTVPGSNRRPSVKTEYRGRTTEARSLDLVISFALAHWTVSICGEHSVRVHCCLVALARCLHCISACSCCLRVAPMGAKLESVRNMTKTQF